MTQVRVWSLKDPNLPPEFYALRDIFLTPEQSTGNAQTVDNSTPRGRNESLHDYFTRRGTKCFCRKCRDEIKRQARENNLSLI